MDGEDEGMTEVIRIRLDPVLKDRATKAAKLKHKSVSALIRDALVSAVELIEREQLEAHAAIGPHSSANLTFAPSGKQGPTLFSRPSHNVVAGKFTPPPRRAGSIQLPELGDIAASDEDPLGDLRKLATAEFDDELQIERTVEVPAWWQDEGARFVLRVKGDSMNAAEPTPIYNGERVIMAIRQPLPGEIVAAICDGKTTLKRLAQQTTDGRFVLVSESHNPRHRNVIPVTELRVCGVMIGKYQASPTE